MKLSKRVLSAALTIAMVFSPLTSMLSPAAADNSTRIYVDNVNGLSSNSGETPD